MGTIADGVEFDTIAREWRCKVRELVMPPCAVLRGGNLPMSSEQIVMWLAEAYVNEDTHVSHGVVYKNH